ncbi:MAG: diguanylate cyclase domain-containing protein [Beijerinckiaceae bacterium]
MAEDEISVEVVESFIRARHKTIAFTPALERRFEQDTRLRRTQKLKAITLVMLLVYNLFLGADFVLVQDQLGLSAALHFAIVSPWMLLVVFWMRADHPRQLRECAAASIPLFIVFQILLVSLASRSPYADHYQYLVLLPILFAVMNQRLPYAYAGAVSIGVVGCHAVTVIVAGKMPLPVALMASAFVFCCTYTTLVGGFYLERDSRRAYLQKLLDALRLEQSNAASRLDALTGLANRRLLGERLEQLWQAGDDRASPVAAIMLDIDHFKAFNDSYGHLAGDACLKRIAGCIVAELRGERDLAARFGGEEMLLLLPRTELTDAIWTAERIRRSIEALGLPHEFAGMRQIVTASFGVAAAPVSMLSAAELIAAADIALYAAKRAGRNQVWPPAIRALTTVENQPDAALHAAQR